MRPLKNFGFWTEGDGTAHLEGFPKIVEARMEVMLTLEGRQELRVTRIGMAVGRDQSLPVVKDFLVG